MTPDIWSTFFRGVEETQCFLARAPHVLKCCSIRKRREFRRCLIEKSSLIHECQPAVKLAIQNFELFQYHPNYYRANKTLLIMGKEITKLLEIFINDNIQHNIKSAILNSTNIYERKIKPVYNKIQNDRNKFNNIFAPSKISQAS